MLSCADFNNCANVHESTEKSNLISCKAIESYSFFSRTNIIFTVKCNQLNCKDNIRVAIILRWIISIIIMWSMQALSARLDDDSCFFIQWIKGIAINTLLGKNLQGNYLLY